MSVYPPAYLKNHMSKNSRHFLCILGQPVAVVWSSSDNNSIGYVLRVLWITTCFHARNGHIQTKKRTNFQHNRKWTSRYRLLDSVVVYNSGKLRICRAKSAIYSCLYLCSSSYCYLRTNGRKTVQILKLTIIGNCTL